MTISLSKLAQTIGDSPTLAINAKANALKQEGKPIIHLGGGEPVYPAPKPAIDAIVEKAKSGKIRYSPTTGSPQMKQAVNRYMQENYGKTPQAGEVIVSSGAKQALFNFLLAAVNPGDEVVFPAPYWVSYPEMVRMAGGTPVIVQPSKGISVTLAEIRAALTPQTKAVLINSPCNPSGVVFDEAFIKGVVELTEEKNVFLVMDDIYHKLVFDGKTCPNPYAYAKHGQNLVVINGVSKVYGLTGLRIGWAVSENQELIAAMGRMQAQSTSCNSDLSEAAAAAALTGDQSCVADMRRILQDNRDTLLAELAHIPHVNVTKPQGTFYALADFSYYNKDSQKLAEYLLDKALVAVVPGASFGQEGFLRISFCADKASVTEGVRRIRWALDKTSPAEIKIGDQLVKRD